MSEMLTARETFEHGGDHFTAGVSRVVPDYERLADPTFAQHFGCEEDDLAQVIDELEPRSLAAAARLIDVLMELVELGVVERGSLLVYEAMHLIEELAKEEE